MKVVKNRHFAHFECPHCCAYLSADEPEDLDDHLDHAMFREEGYWDECPQCGRDIWIYITWEPIFSVHMDEC